MAARADNLEIRTDFSLLIDGELVPGDGWLDVINPATERVFARCPAAGETQLDAAVDAARSAFSTWSRLTHEERADYVRRYTAVLAEHYDALVELLVREQGKPIAQARAELNSCLKQADDTVGLQIPVELLLVYTRVAQLKIGVKFLVWVNLRHSQPFPECLLLGVKRTKSARNRTSQ